MRTKITEQFIADFDLNFSRYMEFDFLDKSKVAVDSNRNWRNHCHQSAKLAARALGMLLPGQSVEAIRVQLKARMEDSEHYVDLGNPDDPPSAEGRYRMHWAVQIGSSLYDPTFWQLRNVKTRLHLPDEPYFFARDFFKISGCAEDGTHIVEYQAPEGNLLLGYKLISIPLPPEAIELMLPDGLVRKHARKIAKLCS